MAVGRSEETALGSARGRFLESLPRKAIELRGTIATLTATPAAEGPRAELRRKLHALYASALVFRSDSLAGLAQEGISCLDSASEANRPLSPGDIDLLSGLVKRLTDLRSEERFSATPPRPSGAAPAQSQPLSSPAPTGDSSPPGPRSNGSKLATRSGTLTGLLPVGVPVPTPAEMPGRLVARGSSRPPSTAEFARGRQAPVLQRVLHVLVVVENGALRTFDALLTDHSLRISAVHSARAAVDAAREDAPDVVLASCKLALDGDLLSQLRADPLTDFVPVVLVLDADDDVDLARKRGADELIARPFRADNVKRVLGRVTGTLVEVDSFGRGPQEATLEEVCSRVSEEIRRGLLDAAESGRELKVPLGDNAEIMAAAWAAVARVRAVFAERSAGRVRFSERGAPGTPALLSLNSATEQLAALAGESPLAGRRIVVADDDTAVVLFFAGLLRDEGAYVTEASDGSEALRAARSERPDLIISDVVMPGLDGFALCRELKRDPLLADVPVILISWKEDLLVRMRELSSGAAGYLRKEASAAQILSSVRETLRPRAQLEAQLAEAAEVRGNLEGTGVVALLRSVRRACPDARITLRDAWNLFECELRDGRVAQLTRTASDGSFVRNEAALPQLLGIGSGRYSVARANGALKQALEGTLDEVLARGARELGAQLDALAGDALLEVERIVLDEDAQAALLDHAPEQVRSAIERLASGMPPRELWEQGLFEKELLGAMLVDMTKRGSIRAVLGKDGEDRVAAARALRKAEPTPELAGPLSLLPPAPDPIISVLPMPPEEPSQVLDPLGSVASLPPSTPPAGSILPPAPAPGEQLGEEQVAVRTGPALTIEEQPPSVVNEPAAAQSTPLRPSNRPSDLRELERAAADARSSRGTLWGWTAAFVALLAVGFLIDRAREPEAAPSRVEAIGAPTGPEAPTPSAPAPAVESASAAQPATTPSSSVPEPVKAQEGGFQIYDRVLDSAAGVKANQALVVVEAGPADAEAVLSVDGKPIGSLPAKLPISEGIHELAIARGDTVTYRFLAPRRGTTWVLARR